MGVNNGSPRRRFEGSINRWNKEENTFKTASLERDLEMIRVLVNRRRDAGVGNSHRHRRGEEDVDHSGHRNRNVQGRAHRKFRSEVMMII